MDEQVSANYGKVKKFMADNKLDGVVLAGRSNFSWFTAGKLNYVNAASETGIAALFITAEQCLCITNNIEAPRVKTEELVDSGIEVSEVKWFDDAAAKKLWQQFVGTKNVAADIDVTGLDLPALPSSSTVRLAS